MTDNIDIADLLGSANETDDVWKQFEVTKETAEAGHDAMAAEVGQLLSVDDEDELPTYEMGANLLTPEPEDSEAKPPVAAAAQTVVQPPVAPVHHAAAAEGSAVQASATENETAMQPQQSVVEETVLMPQQAVVDMDIKPQQAVVDMDIKPQQAVVDMDIKPQQAVVDMDIKPQQAVVDMDIKPQQAVVDMDIKPQQAVVDMDIKPQQAVVEGSDATPQQAVVEDGPSDAASSEVASVAVFEEVVLAPKAQRIVFEDMGDSVDSGYTPSAMSPVWNGPVEDLSTGGVSYAQLHFGNQYGSMSLGSMPVGSTGSNTSATVTSATVTVKDSERDSGKASTDRSMDSGKQQGKPQEGQATPQEAKQEGQATPQEAKPSSESKGRPPSEGKPPLPEGEAPRDDKAAPPTAKQEDPPVSLLQEQGISMAGSERFWQRGHFVQDCDEYQSTSAFDVCFWQGDSVFVRADNNTTLWQVKIPPDDNGRDFVCVTKIAVKLGALVETPAAEKKRVKANKKKIGAREKQKKKELKAMQKAKKQDEKNASKVKNYKEAPGKVQIPQSFRQDLQSSRQTAPPPQQGSAGSGQAGGSVKETPARQQPAGQAPYAQQQGGYQSARPVKALPPEAVYSLSTDVDDLSDETLRKLAKLVTDSELLLFKSCTKVLDKDNVKQISTPWVNVLSYVAATANVQALPFLESYISTDVRHAKAQGIKALHRDKLSTRLVMAYAHQESLHFFREIVSDLITNMREVNTGSYEVNTDKLRRKDDFDRNYTALTNAFTFFLDRVLDPETASKCPLVCDMLRIVQKHAGSKQPHVVTDFYFCRFLQPVMMDPMRFGVVYDTLTSEERRNLQWICRILISISTHVKFDACDKTYSMLNAFVAEHIDRVTEFSASLVAGEASSTAVVPCPFPETPLKDIYRIIAANMTKIKNNATGVGLKRFDMRAFNNGVKLMTTLQTIYPNV